MRDFNCYTEIIDGQDDYELKYQSKYGARAWVGDYIIPMTKKDVRGWCTGYARQGVKSAKPKAKAWLNSTGSRLKLQNYEFPSWNGCYINTMLYAAFNEVEHPAAEYVIQEGFFLVRETLDGTFHRAVLMHHSRLKVVNPGKRWHIVDLTYKDAVPLVITVAKGRQKDFVKRLSKSPSTRLNTEISNSPKSVMEHSAKLFASMKQLFDKDLISQDEWMSGQQEIADAIQDRQVEMRLNERAARKQMSMRPLHGKWSLFRRKKAS